MYRRVYDWQRRETKAEEINYKEQEIEESPARRKCAIDKSKISVKMCNRRGLE